MKRYKHELSWPKWNDSKIVSSIIECEDGEWVSWHDVEEYIESFKTGEISSVECNCEEININYGW